MSPSLNIAFVLISNIKPGHAALGGTIDFHSSNILLLANKMAKAITFFTFFVNYILCSGTPKIAISTLGLISKLKASFSVLYISVQ